MKLSSAVSALFLATSSVLAAPLQERQNNQPIIYLQAKTNIATRYEIRQLHDEQPMQYNLFIVAWSRWMKSNINDFESFFKVAGIHGVPQINYNNVNRCNGCDADGYAVHDSVNFPTWHRAYVAFFEQELSKVVKKVASEYPASQRAAYQKAANAWRMPYYDAAAKPKQGSPALPNLMTDFSVVVNGPKGRVSLENPLFRYKIQDPSGFRYQYFTTWDRTLRYPNTNAANAASQTQLSKNAMANVRQSLADQLYSLYTNCHDWLHFASDMAGSSVPSCTTSMEDVHNAVHMGIGGTGNSQGLSGGHMYYLPISAFDPAFWLHHSNVDRWFAMWQTLNPNSWGTGQYSPTGSWTVGAGTPVDATSPLTPFMRKEGGIQGGYWNSDQLRNWRNLGYTFPEYAHSAGDANAITGYINRLYGPNANAVAGSSKRDLISDTLGAVTGATDGTTQGGSIGDMVNDVTQQVGDSPLGDEISSIVNGTMTGLTGITNTAMTMLGDLPIPIGPLAAQNGSVYQYAANIYTPRYALNGTYAVYVFDKEPTTDDVSYWITQENLFGFMGVLSKPGMTDNPVIASGSVPLTRKLQGMVDSGALPDLTEDNVVPYLSKNLVWKVAGPTGMMDPGSIDGFVMSVYASSAPQVDETHLPLWSNFIPLLDVTKDKSGGANSTDDSVAPQQDLVQVPPSSS